MDNNQASMNNEITPKKVYGITPRQKMPKGKKRLFIFIAVLLSLVMVFGVFYCIGEIGYKHNLRLISLIEKTLTPEIHPYWDEETGVWTFDTDRDFKILHLTDIHFGGGFISINRDTWAIKAMVELVNRTKPDLIVITGDMAFPVPFMSGAFNNRFQAVMVIELFERLGIYWTVTMGNHDTEAYSYYNRAQIAQFYEDASRKNNKNAKGLFARGETAVHGEGNHIINIANKNSGEEGKREITQTLVMLDSNTYADGSLLFTYDSIRQNQIDWYEREILRISDISRQRGSEKEVVKSLAFFHIPLIEFGHAWHEYASNDWQDTSDVKYFFGFADEPGALVGHGKYGCRFFATALRLGSTQGVFAGHDHYNNWSVEYKGIRLTYGLSIDYLAYAFMGIHKRDSQRGGTRITVGVDGSFDLSQEFLGIKYNKLPKVY
ncbi:MAG: metallophosphoesterase [Firmicutes bacterium]|nr:metallophosphoesterase [Bacillota bacterium]